MSPPLSFDTAQTTVSRFSLHTAQHRAQAGQSASRASGERNTCWSREDAGDTVSSSGRANLGRRQGQTLQSNEPNHRKEKRLPTAVPSRNGQCCLKKVVREHSACKVKGRDSLKARPWLPSGSERCVENQRNGEQLEGQGPLIEAVPEGEGDGRLHGIGSPGEAAWIAGAGRCS